jgi:glycosyltransferase involved in cell wall biosynthesis
MANVLLNALASTAGGGITYLRNVLPRLGAVDDFNRYFVLVPAGHLNQFSGFATERLSIETVEISGGSLGRLFWEQTVLRNHINTRNINVLVSLGNFALFASPIPQILFNRNDLYFSEYFEGDLKDRGLYSRLISHRFKSLLARYSIKQADINVTPTRAFADRIRRHDGSRKSGFEVLSFGFDAHLFTANDEPLPAEQLDKLDLSEDCYRLLYVSHYNYFRNFETLIRALPMIKRQINDRTGKNVQLVLTTDIRRGAIYGDYDATFAADLIERLGVRKDIAMLGGMPYDRLHRVYRLCDLFVCPSYSESFGHPLVEAMAMGLPVAAANLEVHREICGEASVYFDVFDEEDLAKQCVRVLTDRQQREDMKKRGSVRSRLFSWNSHVNGLVALIERVSSIRRSSARE